MTVYSWKDISGNWTTAGDWTPTGPPTAVDSATIAATGEDYIVAINSVDVADSLTESSADATVDDSLSLTLGAGFALSNGTFNLERGGELSVGTALKITGGVLIVNSGGQINLGGKLSQTGGSLTLNGGTIEGGIIDSTAGTLTINSGTLSGVTFDGPLNLTSGDQVVFVGNGTKFVGSSGSGPGTINITGVNSGLGFDNAQVVRNVTITLGTTTDFDSLYEYDTAEAGNQTLTLASSATVDAIGNAVIVAAGISGDRIVNQGVIDDETGGSLTIYGTFTNSGTIEVASGGAIYIESTTFRATASSLISIGADASAAIGASNAWINLGSITVASGAKLILYGSMSAASLGSISNSGGVVEVGGTYHNSGQTLNGSGAFGQLLLDGGTITGGTVTSAGVGFAVGTLSGVTFEGPLDLTSTDQEVSIVNGAKFIGVSGSGPGTINVAGVFCGLFFDNAQTVSNVTINLGVGYEPDYLGQIDTAGTGNQILTLASSVTVDAVGNAVIEDGGNSGDGIVNNGFIDDQISGSLDIFGNAFTNCGTIDVANSDPVYMDSTTVTNSGTLNVASGGAVTIDSTTFTTTSTSLIAIGANASVTVEPDDEWSNLGLIVVASGGSLELYGSMSAASLGSIDGAVEIAGTYDNSGQMLNGSAAFGQLVLDTGTIIGGTATSAGVGFWDGTLSGVTFDGPLNLTSTSNEQTADLANGTTVVGSSGSGPGTINVTGQSSTLNFDNAQTVSNVTINLGTHGSPFYDSLDQDDTVGGANLVLTLAPTVTIDATGAARIGAAANSGDGIVNQGVIDELADQTDYGLTIFYYGAFTNSGMFDDANGGKAQIESNTFTNSGTIEVASGGTVWIEPGIFTDSGVIDVASGAAVWIQPPPTGAATLAGLVNGLGTLELAGGPTTVEAGARLDTADWVISVFGTMVTLEEALAYAGAFSEGAGATLTLAGPLTLTGRAALSGAIYGAGQLVTKGATTISDLTLGGTVVWTNSSKVTETGGNFTLGDVSGARAILANSSTGTFDLTGDSGIALGASTASYISNAGELVKTGPGRISSIGSEIVNSGTIAAASGTLDLKGLVTGAGKGQVDAGATLEVDATVVAGQTISYSGSGGDLLLGDLDIGGLQLFHGAISGFGAGDKLDAGAPFAFPATSFSFNSTNDMLTLTNGSLHASIHLLGSYAQDNFTPQDDGHGGTLFTFDPTS